jgi:hypothetical protein
MGQSIPVALMAYGGGQLSPSARLIFVVTPSQWPHDRANRSVLVSLCETGPVYVVSLRETTWREGHTLVTQAPSR